MNARVGVRPRDRSIASLAGTVARWTLPLLVVALSSGAASAATYTWIGTNPGTWTTAANWSPARTTPAADDVLVFDGTGTPSPFVQGVITQGIGRMVLANGVTLTLQGPNGSPPTISLNGGTGTDLDVPAGTELILAGGSGRPSLALATGATGLVAGSMDVSGQVTAADAGGLTFASGAVLTFDGIPGSHVFGTTNLNSVVFQDGSTYIAKGGSDPFGATAPASVVVFQTGSLYQYENGDTPSIAGRTYADFAYASASSKTLSGSLPFTVDNLTLTDGTMHVQVATTTIQGDIWEAGGQLDFDSPGQDIFLAGTSPQSVRASLVFAINSTVTVSNPTGVALESGSMAPSNLVMNGGELTLANGTPLAITRQLTLTSGVITTGSNLVQLTSQSVTVVGGSAASYINGNFQKPIPVSAGVLQMTFEIGDATTYAPVTLSFPSVSTAGVVAASTHPGDHASLGTSGLDVVHSVNRFWVLSNNATVFAPCSATFTFAPADVDAGSSTAQFEVRRFGAPAFWSSTTTGTRTATTTQCSGLTVFGDFAIGESCGVTLFHDDLDGTPGVDLVGTTPDFGGSTYVGMHIQPTDQIHFAAGGGVEDVGPNLRSTATICQSTLETPLTLSALPAGEMLHYRVTMANISATPETNVFESSRVDLVMSNGDLVTLGELSFQASPGTSNNGNWGANSSLGTPITSHETTMQSGATQLDLYLDPFDEFGDGPAANAYLVVNGGTTRAGSIPWLVPATTISAVQLVRNVDDEVSWRELTLERVRACGFPPPPPCTPAPDNTVAFTRVDVPAGSGPWGLGVADLDGNGTLDLAVADYGSNAVTTLSGDGAGGFAAGVSHPSGASPVSMAIGDVTGDSKPDLVVANFDGGDFMVYAGDGIGGFAAPVSTAISGSRPISARLGLLDANASLDLFVPDWNNVHAAVYHNDGSGNFVADPAAPTGDGPYDAALADLNGDGALDAVVANRGRLANGSTVSVLLGNGSAGFTSAGTVTVGSLPAAVAIGDVDGDGLLDMAVANNGDGTVSVLYGDGLGAFGSRTDFAVGNGPTDVAIADLDGDGGADLAAVNSLDGTVAVLVSDCAGGFLAPIDFAVGASPRRLVVADLDNDGFDDLVVSNAGESTVSVLRNRLGDSWASSVVYRGVTNTALGGAQLQNSGDVSLHLGFIGSSGQDGVSFGVADPLTPLGLEFDWGGLELDPGADVGGRLEFSLHGDAEGDTATLATVRVDVTASGLDLMHDFAGSGAEFETVELYDGEQLVHACVVDAGTVIHRDAAAAPHARSGGASLPARANAAGDGIKDVEVGLKKKPGGSLLNSVARFTGTRPTTVAGVTVGASRVEVSALASRLPINVDRVELRVASPSAASHLHEIGISREPAFVSDSSGKVSGLAAIPRGGASIWMEDAWEWTVTGIGSSGQDGVECLLTNAGGAEHRFGPGEGFSTARDAGARLLHTLRAGLDCTPDSLVGTVTETVYDDSITVRSDFSYLGATQVRVDLLSNGSVVHTGVYGLGQSVRLVAPPPGPGMSAQAASINTSRSHIKDRASITAGIAEPEIEWGWLADPGAYRLEIDGSTYAGDAVRFSPADGVSLGLAPSPNVPTGPIFTQAGFYQLNPGVPALDTLRFLRPGLALGQGKLWVRALGSSAMTSPDGDRVVVHHSSLWGMMQDGVECVAPVPAPKLSMRVSGVEATSATPATARVTVSATGLTSGATAASSSPISIARSASSFVIGPDTGDPASYRLQVFSGPASVADVTVVMPEATVPSFPDRLGCEASEQAFVAEWDVPVNVAVTGGGSVSGDRVRITPVSPTETLVSLTGMNFTGTDVNHLEFSDLQSPAVTAVGDTPARPRVALAVLGSPARASEPLGFAVQLPGPQAVKLELFDVVGRRIATVHDGLLPAGTTRLEWRPGAGSSAGGLMLARLVTPGGTRTTKFVLLR